MRLNRRLFPPLEQLMFQSKLVKYLADSMVNEVWDSFGVMIKCRHWRHFIAPTSAS